MANRYWVGGSGDWSDTAHWSTTSGGSGGSSVPTSADYVRFNNLSYPAGVSSTINFDIDPTAYVISFSRTLEEPQNNINFNGKTITVALSLILNYENFDLDGATINFGILGTTLDGNLAFYNIGNPIYSTENLIINVIRRNNVYSSTIRFEQNGLTIPNIFIDFSNDAGTGHVMLFAEENCYINIGTLSNNFQNDMTSHVYIVKNTGGRFYFTNFNLSGSLENKFKIVLSGYDSDLGVGTVDLYQTSGTVDVQGLTIYYVNVLGGATWINKYSDQLEPDESVSGWTYYSPLYWIGNSGELTDITNWSLTSGGSPVGVYVVFGSGYEYILYDLVFDENSFVSDNSIISFSNYSKLVLRSINTTNVTKTFTIQSSNTEPRTETTDIEVLSATLSNKVTLTGSMVNENIIETILSLNCKYHFTQNNAILGPQFLLSNWSLFSSFTLEIHSNLLFQECSGIYIKPHEPGESVSIVLVNFNGFSIDSPIVVFSVTSGGPT